jgi:hypothetical protein
MASTFGHFVVAQLRLLKLKSPIPTKMTNLWPLVWHFEMGKNYFVCPTTTSHIFSFWPPKFRNESSVWEDQDIVRKLLMCSIMVVLYNWHFWVIIRHFWGWGISVWTVLTVKLFSLIGKKWTHTLTTDTSVLNSRGLGRAYCIAWIQYIWEVICFVCENEKTVY